MHIDTHDLPARIDAYPLEFSGRGGEYFRVWIVNVLLTIVTLGFYTPFARRRTAQYFWGHTIVAASPLEFTAQQRKMVIGFVLLVALYMAFNLAADTGQELATSLLALGAAALAPYFWGSAIRFRLNATRWRGVRLQFTASWGEIYKASWPVFAIALVWLAWGALMAATIPEKPAGGAKGFPMSNVAWGSFIGGTLFAFALTLLAVVRLEFNAKSLLVARARIGGQPGRCKPVFSDFVRIWAMTALLLVGGVLLIAVLMGVLFAGSIAPVAGAKGGGAIAFLLGLVFFVVTVFLLFFASTPARAYREARIFQLVWNNVGVSHIARFKCDLKAGRYVWLRVKNSILTLLTLGFYRPFALVSEYAMKTGSVTLHVKGGLDQLAGQLAREEQGLGDAIADAVGLDLVG